MARDLYYMPITLWRPNYYLAINPYFHCLAHSNKASRGRPEEGEQAKKDLGAGKGRASKRQKRN